MGWWPFGKKRKNKKAEKLQISEPKSTLNNEALPPRDSGRASYTALHTSSSERVIEPQHFYEKPYQAPPPVHQTRPREPPPRPARTPPRSASTEDITALPVGPRRVHSPRLGQLSNSDLNKARQGPSLARDKSDKRRRDDRSREEELKSNPIPTSSPVPIPKRTGAISPRDLYRRGNRPTSGGAYPDPSSVISLSGPPSVRSSMTGFSDDTHRFNVGTMDLLSPRPTLRYSLHGQYTSGATLSSPVPSRSNSKREPRTFSRPAIPEADTIDEYANTMDARTLRELMDRDTRRKERKRKTEGDRARRKLDRLAAAGDSEARDSRRRARRKEAEARVVQKTPDVGPSGTAKQYGIESAHPALRSEEVPVQDPFRDPIQEPLSQVEQHVPRDAGLIAAPAVLQNVHPDPIATVPYSEVTEVSPPASPVQHYRAPSDLSQATDPRTTSANDLSRINSSGSRRTSEPAASRRSGALAALFRRSGIYKRKEPPVPSEGSFSNTSREEMRERFSPSPDSGSHERTYRRQSSGVPVRTKSKFREELTDAPTIQPAQPSPEAVEAEQMPPLPSEQYRFGGDGAEAGFYKRESYDSAMAPSAALLSQSLASVDSEGSWLSGGRPKKRASQQMSIGGRSSFVQRPSTLGGPSTDDLGFHDNPSPSARRSYGAADQPHSLTHMRFALSADDEEMSQDSPIEERINEGTVSRRPTLVSRYPRVQSSEGLLRQFTDDSLEVAPTPFEHEYETADDVTPGATPGASPDQVTPEAYYTSKPRTQQATEGYGQIQQAKQAYGSIGHGHARTISAGSAKLLDIPARRDSQRISPTSEKFPDT